MRRTKASLIYWCTKNLRAVQLLLGHTHLDHVSPYLDVTVREQLDALSAFDRLEWD
jgi:integrase/recombinase XerD